MPEKPTYAEMEKKIQNLEAKLSETGTKLKDEISIRKSLENKFLIAFETNPAGMVFTSLKDGRVIDVNKSYTDITGYNRQESIGKTSIELGFWPNPGDREKVTRKLKAQGSLSQMEFAYRHKSGEMRVGYFWITMVDIDLKPCILTSLVDATEKNRMVETLKQYERIISSTNDHMSFIDKNYIYQAVNDAYVRHSNKSREEIVGHSVVELWGEDVFNHMIKDKLDQCMNGRQIQYQAWFDFPAMGRRYMDVAYYPYQEEDGSIMGAMVSGRDITKLKKAEDDLKKSEAKFREMAGLLPNMILEMDLDFRATYINNLGLETFGLSQDDVYAGIRVLDLIHPDEREDAVSSMERLAAGGVIRPGELKLIKKDGAELVAYINASPIHKNNRIMGARISLTDITEQKQIQEQLLTAKKLESIGTLAGGIAHQFNNALYAITGNIELLEMDLPDHEGIQRYTEAMKDSAVRMSGLTAQLLAYAQGGKYQAKNLDINDFVSETITLVQHSIDPAIEIKMDLSRETLRIKADLTQMQMLLSAVMTNASEAVEKNGCIRIVCRKIAVTDEMVREFHGLAPGNHACLSISDNGKGMDEQTRNRIFDPFFTTKFKGRGLGLAAAYGIIMNHQGWISVDSGPGKGTTVNIYLPTVKVPGKKVAAVESPLIKGTGTILVVDDDESVLEVSRAMLERQGYHVLEAQTGQEAIDVINTYDGPIDLAILDILLPDMNGNEIYPYLIKSRADLKVIVCSGYSIDGPAQELLNAGANDFIQKPFTMVDLSEKLKRTLGGKQ